MLQHKKKNVLSLLYLGCDFNFIILAFFSTFYSSHPALLVATFELMLLPKTKTLKFTAIAIYSIPIKTTTTQFIFIMQKFNKFHYASYSKFKHPKQDNNSPKLSIMLYQKQILKSNQEEEEDTAPFF